MSSQTTYDVIIIGGGIIGAATAEHLSRHGRRVLLLEQFQPDHKQGSSHGDGRIIRFAYPEPIYVQMARQTYPAWAEIEARSKQKLIHTTGGWDAGPADALQLRELIDNLSTFDIPFETLDAAQSNRRFPQFRLEPGDAAVVQPDAGVLLASRTVHALWHLAADQGAEMRTGVRVSAVEPHGDGVRVSAATPDGNQTFMGRRAVLAVGGWASKLLRPLGIDLPLKVTHEQVAYFAPQAGTAVSHAPGDLPIFLDFHTGDRPFYGLPQVHADAPVKVGWHHTGPKIDPDGERPLRAQNLRDVQAWVRQRMPHLNPKALGHDPCLYTDTADLHFVLDTHPQHPQIVLAAGFSGHGFKFAPVVAHILAALAFGDTPPVNLDTFRLNRFDDPANLQRRTGA